MVNSREKLIHDQREALPPSKRLTKAVEDLIDVLQKFMPS